MLDLENMSNLNNIDLLKLRTNLCGSYYSIAYKRGKETIYIFQIKNLGRHTVEIYT